MRFALWLYLVSKLLANGCPSQMHPLSQLSSPRLLEHVRKSLASKMSPPWYLAPWLHLVCKLLGNWCPSQMPDFGGQSPDSLQIHILGISIPNAQCMQNLGSIRPLGSILGLLSHIKRSFAVPLFKKKHENLVLGLLLLLLKKTLELVKNVTFWVIQKNLEFW